jgi:DNA helicase-4
MLRNGIVRALISGVREIKIEESGLLVRPLFGGARFHNYVSLCVPISTNQGWLGSSFSIGGETVIGRLSPSDATRLVEAYAVARLAFWRSRIVSERNAMGKGIDLFAKLREGKRYLRTSVCKACSESLQPYRSALENLGEYAPLGMTPPKGAEEFRDFMTAPEAWRTKFNEHWTRAQENRFVPLFESLEKHPLTPGQRKACVVDEDNVLVLAGAGTGKTSTMIAKAAYLLRSGLAQPDEILMLAFAKKARDELQARLLGIEGMGGVRVETFHSLGSKIIGSVEGTRLAVSVLAQDDKSRTKFIDDSVTELQSNKDFLAQLREFFCSYLVPMPNELNFKTPGEYIHYLKNHEIRSLKGDVVKSFAELEIANHLFLNGIEYVYERSYEHATATASRQQYKPDFYLPELSLYIEHFGIDRNGNTAPYIDKRDYLEGMDWKRGIHGQYGTHLIETYSYERQEGVLLKVLEERLIAHCEEAGVEFDSVGTKYPFETLKKLGSYAVFSRLLDGFLNVFKGSTWNLPTLRETLGADRADTRLRVFLRIFEEVLARYEDALARSRTIDFNDMVKKATGFVQGGEFRSTYRYIMVDEFQDISPARAVLVKVLRDQVPGCALFSVGDDWQAIYRFTGSDVSLTTKFRENFGATERVDLDMTFRFNNKISDVASRFVQTNPGQLRKVIGTHAKSDRAEIEVISETDRAAALLQALDAVAARAGRKKAAVFLLARYNDSEPADLKNLQSHYPNLDLAFHSVHRSKGLEADYVIILDVIEGKKGFPSLMATDPIIERILPNAEEFEHAEERRLFYVALTRARQSVWLLTRPGRESPFITELLQGSYAVSFDRAAMKAKVSAMARCPVCMEGVLERRSGRKGDFYGCSFYPYCEGTALSCPACGNGALTSDGHRHRCSNPDCSFEAETCPSCGVGYLKLNTNGRYGPFYGCTNWRGDGPTSCRYKRKAPQASLLNQGVQQ